MNTSEKHLDINANSYWQHDINMRNTVAHVPLPAHAQVVLVGAGLTNLVCALHLQRAGWHTVILEANFAGAGCSARSGGFMSPTHAYTAKNLARILGVEKRDRLLNEMYHAYDHIINFIKSENLDVDLQGTGRLTALTKQNNIDTVRRNVDELYAITGRDYHFVEKSDVGKYVNSPLYEGGTFCPISKTVHPAKMTQAIINLCEQAGVTIVAPCRVESINNTPQGSGKTVQTDKGTITADVVVSGTNGYTNHYGIFDRGFAMRLMPLYSMIVVTPEMSKKRLNDLMPNNVSISESTRRHCYYRQAPCGKRLMLGGRASLLYMPRDAVKASLEQMMEDIFQQQSQSLPKLEAQYTWLGRVGFTHTRSPYIHKVSDSHYRVGGYSGTGMMLGQYLGYQTSQLILNNHSVHDTVYTDMTPSPYPHAGGGWFLSPLNTFYRIKDYVMETY